MLQKDLMGAINTNSISLGISLFAPDIYYICQRKLAVDKHHSRKKDSIRDMGTNS
jgi:hypothetical protein